MRKLAWDSKSFLDVFEDRSGGNVKTPQSEYLEEGNIPIVDQGRSLIGGFTDDPDRVCKVKPPVIVFGDHTRCFKYIDFPFAMGADGVKVLKPKIQADTKFLFYYLDALKLPEGGYDRHFKYLKRTEIIVPPILEQHRIAAILDKAAALREKRRQAINKLNTLLQSVFLDMFGDPVSNPKGWKPVQLGEALELITYGLTVRPQYIDVGFPLISAREIRQGYIDFDNAPKISKEDFDRVSDKGKPKKDDILFSKTGSIGHSAIVLSDQAFAVSQNAARLKFSEEIVPEFGLHYLRLEMIQTLAKRTAKGNAVKDLQLGDMRKFPFYLPPIDLQRKFLSNQRKLEEVKATMRGSYSSAQTMFRSLQQRAFNGELFKPHG